MLLSRAAGRTPRTRPEPINKKIKRRGPVVGIVPDAAAVIKLIGVVGEIAKAPATHSSCRPIDTATYRPSRRLRDPRR